MEQLNETPLGPITLFDPTSHLEFSEPIDTLKKSADIFRPLANQIAPSRCAAFPLFDFERLCNAHWLIG